MPVTMQAYAMNQFGETTSTSLSTIIDDPLSLLITSRATLSSPPSGTLDILSASRYPQGLMQPYQEAERPRKRKATSTEPFFGGLVLTGHATDSNRSSSAETEVSPAPKKRPRRVKGHETEEAADGKKQRGRPRLDTQDETAADRRRTQIRLAQRAYRHRKETTISALKQKAQELRSTIDQMNKTFGVLHDNLVDAGVLHSHHALTQQLKAAAEEFVSLSKRAPPESDEEGDGIAKMAKSTTTTTPAITKDESGVRSSTSSSRRTSTESQKPSPKALQSTRKTHTSLDVSSATFNQSFIDAHADIDELPSATNPSLTLPHHGYVEATPQFYNESAQFNVQIPEIPLFDTVWADKLGIERPLKNPGQHQGSYTYSFQETTFARRLHRMCLERAFRSLTDPATDPALLHRAFRFSFCFSNRKRMLQRFQDILKRKAGESLENWNVPFLRVGGAGMHFPRRDENGNPIYPPNMVSPARIFGPRPWIEVETPRWEATTEEMLEAIGFNGEWFDSHDVEEYLKTKGIYLDGSSSFVEIDASVVTSALASTPSHSSRSQSTASSSPLDVLRTPSPLVNMSDPTTDPIIAQELNDMYTQSGSLALLTSANASATNDAATSSPSFFSPKPQDDFGWASSGEVPTFEDLLMRQPNPVVVDVERFLERMVDGGVCLGRAPGFRKEVIDHALALSLQEAF